MQAYQLLIGSLDAEPGTDFCPWGLLMPADYGDGVMIAHCKLMAGHKEPHCDKVAFPLGSGRFVTVVITWNLSKHLIPVGGGVKEPCDLTPYDIKVPLP